MKLSELEDADRLVTKDDIKDAIHELKDFIREREVTGLRWMIGIQITYFFGTLASVWFLIAHYKP